MNPSINPNPHVVQQVLKENKTFPNSEFEILLYQGSLNLPEDTGEATEYAKKVFQENGWTNAWTNGIYDFHHYHGTAHECLAICNGSATVMLGGPRGKKFKLRAGDVLILPAGVGHKCLESSEDFTCVGAYPDGQDYDMNVGTKEEYEKAIINIIKLPLPEKDPVYGEHGFLKAFWKEE